MNRIAAAFVALPFAVATLAGCPADPETPAPTDPSTLEAPPKGQGFQFRTQLAPVAPGEEIQDCYFYRVRDLAKQGGLPENEPVNLHRVRIAQREGSHHMNLFRVATIRNLDPNKETVSKGKNGQGECFKSSNWAEWPLVANSQVDGDVDWTFPDGVANVFQPDEWIMLQTHYVNATTQKTPDDSEVAVNWYTMPKDQVKSELGTLFATKQNIRVCKNNPTPEFSGTCHFNNPEQPIHIIGANGHFHGRGRQFDMYASDGKTVGKPDESARFYRSDSWDEPPMLRSPELNREMAPGSAVFFSCAFQWSPPPEEIGGCKTLDDNDTKSSEPKDCCYTFGPIVERNEHCNAFVYYWPKQNKTDVTCD